MIETLKWLIVNHPAWSHVNYHEILQELSKCKPVVIQDSTVIDDATDNQYLNKY